MTSIAEWDEELLQFTSGWVRREGQTVVAADRRFHRPYNRDTVKVFNDGKVRFWEIETTCRCAGAVVKQNEASHAPAPRETSAPGGEGAVVLSSLRSNARAKKIRSQPSLELVTKKSRSVWKVGRNGRANNVR